MKPARVLGRVRLAVWGLALLGTAYMVWRFDRYSLPEGACSPVLALDPGDRLLVDTRPPAFAEGDLVLFEGARGKLLLGAVGAVPASAPAEAWSRVEAGALWIVADRPDCPAEDSRFLGPIEPDAIRGRVIFSWGS